MATDVFYATDMFHTPWHAKDVVSADRYTHVARLETDNVEVAYREMNVVEGYEWPTKIRCRSMSVGDLAVVGGQAFLCAGCGFEPLPSDVADKLVAPASVVTRALLCGGR